MLDRLPRLLPFIGLAAILLLHYTRDQGDDALFVPGAYPTTPGVDGTVGEPAGVLTEGERSALAARGTTLRLLRRCSTVHALRA